MMKKNCLILLLGLILIPSTVAISAPLTIVPGPDIPGPDLPLPPPPIFLPEIDVLQIARAADGSLWKRACVGSDCGTWAKISGVLHSSIDPTVYWSEADQKFFLVGVVPDGTIWMSSFNADGTFNNDWASAGGSSSSPIFTASRGPFHRPVYDQTSDGSSVVLTTAAANIKDVSFRAPDAGFAFCRGSGVIQHSRTSISGTSFATIYLVNTSNGTSLFSTFTDLPNGTPSGITSFPFSVSRVFTISGPGIPHYYMTGDKGGSHTGDGGATRVWNANLICEYFPYTY